MDDLMPEDRPEKPTLKTIAKISGLAVPTVSRALNDAPDIGKATKERVRAIAADIGYVPDHAGIRLRTGRTNVISLVLSPQPDLTNHTGSLIASIANELQGSQFHMNVTPYTPTDDFMAPIKYIVENRSADAIIINQVQPEDERVVYMKERNFPFVTHGRSIWCNEHPYYDFDNDAVARLAMQQFAKFGRRTALLIAPPREQHYAIHMIKGATAEGAALGVDVKIHPTAHSEMDRIDLTDLICEALATQPQIDAILAGSTSAAMAAVAALEQSGRTLSVDIDVFSKEAVPILDWFRPGILKVYEDVTRAGTFLAKAAMQAARQTAEPPMQCLEKPVI